LRVQGHTDSLGANCETVAPGGAQEET
jgi:hypothetical protein